MSSDGGETLEHKMDRLAADGSISEMASALTDGAEAIRGLRLLIDDFQTSLNQAANDRRHFKGERFGLQMAGALLRDLMRNRGIENDVNDLREKANVSETPPVQEP
jgi:hypothetical protein